jgi:hypothetical protein
MVVGVYFAVMVFYALQRVALLVVAKRSSLLVQVPVLSVLRNTETAVCIKVWKPHIVIFA